MKAVIGATVPRMQALEQLRDADLVFIAYSSQDLRSASDLRQRMARIRTGRNANSIFLAHEDLPPGKPVSSAVIEDRLLKSNLVVVLCGKHTSKSPFVEREVALANRARIQILPVILQPGVILPKGLDFEVQAIHLLNLFPAIRWTRVALMALAGVLVAIASTAAVLAWRANVAQERTKIQTWLDVDAASPHSPLDLSRRSSLEAYRRRAMQYSFAALVAEIDRRLRNLPSPSGRRTILERTLGRISLAPVMGNGAPSSFWLGTRDRVVLVDASDGSLRRTINLAGSSPEPLAAHVRNSDIDGSERRPATLSKMEWMPQRGGIAFEVEYDGASRQATAGSESFDRAKEWLNRGSRIRGNERELLIIAGFNGILQTAGLTQRLKYCIAHDLNGEENGADWFEIDPTSDRDVLAVISEVNGNAFESALSTLAKHHLASIAGEAEFKPKDVVKIHRLAEDPDTGVVLVQVEIEVDPGQRVWELSAGMKDHFLALIDSDGRIVQITPQRTYHPEAGMLAFAEDDQDEPRANPPPWKALPNAGKSSGSIESRLPGWSFGALAMKANRAFAFGTAEGAILIDLKTGKSERFEIEAISVTLSITGACTVQLSDGSLELRELGTGVRRRFLNPPDALAMAPSPDGLEVFVLFSDGRVDAWRWHAFGVDGWAATN